jgi:type II secretory pathway predicted ATPase ExeA
MVTVKIRTMILLETMNYCKTMSLPSENAPPKSAKAEDQTTGEREAMTVAQKIVAQDPKIVALVQKVVTNQVVRKTVAQNLKIAVLAQKDRTAVLVQKVVTSQIVRKTVVQDLKIAVLAQRDRTEVPGLTTVVLDQMVRNVHPAMKTKPLKVMVTVEPLQRNKKASQIIFK